MKRSIAIFCVLLTAACQDKTPPSDVIQYDFTDQFNSVSVKDVTPPADPLAQQAIQELVYIYLVVGKELLDTYKVEAIAYAAELKAQEIQESEDRLNELLAQIDADFEETIAQAKAVRDNAFNNCHNQGG